MPSALGLVVGPIGYRPKRGFFIIFSIIIISISIPLLADCRKTATFKRFQHRHPQIIHHRKEDSAWIHLEMSKTTTKKKHKDKYGEKDKDIHEESLPVFISLGTLSSNE